jgi:hypothetical protein
MRRLLTLAVGLWTAISSLGAAPGSALAQGSPVPSIETEPVYQPPMRGAPRGRVGGGTRGITPPAATPPPGAAPAAPTARSTDPARESVFVVALAPDHPGRTTEAQPSLYWFLSRPSPREIEVTVIEASAVKPMLEKKLPGPTEPGVQRINLAEHGISLEIGKRYQWFVSLVLDPQARSKDIVAGGVIERVAAPAGLEGADRGKAQSLAQHGLWYDALNAISEQIAANPADPRLRQHRAALLDQIGLTEVARLERGR